MTVYADYSFYLNAYKGQSATQEDFDRLAIEASAFLRRACHDRIAEVTDDVKLATCAVIDALVKFAERDGKAGESEGNYSVTYLGGANRAGESETLDGRLLDAAKTHLAHTGLLYAGVRL